MQIDDFPAEIILHICTYLESNKNKFSFLIANKKLLQYLSYINITYCISKDIFKIKYKKWYNQITILEIMRSIKIFKFPTKLQKLQINNEFNKILTIPNTVKELIFDDSSTFNNFLLFDHNSNIKKIKFSEKFNFDFNIPESVEYLKFGIKFNKNLIFPTNAKIKKLKFDYESEFNKNFNVPDSLEVLKFGNTFNSNLIFSANTKIKKIKFGAMFDQHFNVPDSLEELKIINSTFNKIITFSKNTKIKLLCLVCCDKIITTRTNIIPNSLEKLKLREHFNSDLNFHQNSNIKSLEFNCNKVFDKKIMTNGLEIFPDSLEYLKLSRKFEQNINFSQNSKIKIIQFPYYSKFKGNILVNNVNIIPNSLEMLFCGININLNLIFSQNSKIKFIQCGSNSKINLILPDFIQNIDISKNNYYIDLIMSDNRNNFRNFNSWNNNNLENINLWNNIDITTNDSQLNIKCDKNSILNIKWPKSLKILSWRDIKYPNININPIPDSVEELNVGFDTRVIFSEKTNIKKLKLDNNFNNKVIISDNKSTFQATLEEIKMFIFGYTMPDSIEELYLNENFQQKIEFNATSKIKKITVSKNYLYDLNHQNVYFQTLEDN